MRWYVIFYLLDFSAVKRSMHEDVYYKVWFVFCHPIYLSGCFFYQFLRSFNNKHCRVRFWKSKIRTLVLIKLEIQISEVIFQSFKVFLSHFHLIFVRNNKFGGQSLPQLVNIKLNSSLCSHIKSRIDQKLDLLKINEQSWALKLANHVF